MKILMLGAGNPPSTFIQRQIDILRSRQIHVELFLGFRKHKYLGSLLCKRGFTFHLSMDMKASINSADILHFQWPSHWITYGSLARKFRKPSVLSLRGRQINILPYLPGQQGYVRNLKNALPHCTAYHCVSEDIMDEAARFGLASERAWVIRPAVDTSFFVPSEKPPGVGPFRIAMVGALIWRKGYEYALMALQQMVADGVDATLTIAGEGDERDRVEYTIRDLGLDGRVSLLGKQSPVEIKGLLQSSHVLLHASLSEGIANVVLEAMSCGLPVVAVDSGGLREVIDDSKEGFLVPSRDTKSMSDRLSDLYRYPELRQALGTASRMRAIKEFDLLLQGEKFVHLYQKIMQQK